MSGYTVIGYWDDSDERVVVGVIEGEHAVSGGDDVSEGGSFAEWVEADSSGDAEDMVNGAGEDVEFG